MNARPEDARVVLSTCPDRATAERIARALVDERLAACVNLLPGVHSIYRWRGAVESVDEVMLVAKTTAAATPGLVARLAELHPYEVPEAIALDVPAGAMPYLDWIRLAVSPP